MSRETPASSFRASPGRGRTATSPDGGEHPTDGEIERVADHLRSAEIEQRVRWLTDELLEGSRLAEVMSTRDTKTSVTSTTGCAA